ncbi:MAG: hypothetical protein RLZZ126_1166 [Pseudomonadota bacterium]|jgi:uncharacterized protein
MAEPTPLLSLPLFPLGTVLFPGGVLPLRIFEVRYLDMIGKCHKAGAPFGVVTLTQGGEVRTAAAAHSATPESFHAVGTLAQITHLESPQSGLLLIRCEGRGRFRIMRQECLKHGLWVGDVEHLADDAPVPVPPDLQAAATALQRVLKRIDARSAEKNEQISEQSEHSKLLNQEHSGRRLNDCGWVANRWCELLPLPSQHKHRLMALDSPLMRLELVSDFLRQAKIVR